MKQSDLVLLCSAAVLTTGLLVFPDAAKASPADFTPLDFDAAATMPNGAAIPTDLMQMAGHPTVTPEVDPAASPDPNQALLVPHTSAPLGTGGKLTSLPPPPTPVLAAPASSETISALSAVSPSPYPSALADAERTVSPTVALTSSPETTTPSSTVPPTIAHPSDAMLNFSLGGLADDSPVAAVSTVSTLSPVVAPPTSTADASTVITTTNHSLIPSVPEPAEGTTSPILPSNVLTLFQGDSNSLVAIAVGSAEGTRTPRGGKTRAYRGHSDPGNGVWNLGSFSYQHGADSPEEADAKQLKRLQSQASELMESASEKGLSLTIEQVLNGIDLANQSPAAALSRGGYIDRLAQAEEMGLQGTEAILWARTRSYLDPDSGRWNAPGLGNTVGSITHDQQRRMDAIASALEQNPPTSQIAALTQTSASNSSQEESLLDKLFSINIDFSL